MSQAMSERQDVEQATRIKCRWCDLAETCDKRARKEKYENAGWSTRCTMTPKRAKKKKKKKAASQN
ncbi:hypothetical protein ACK8P5_25790 (plasmid) [Paenibacillus sp. EC2-1]|uniref:hypothetical protein n=1 Tax=Paenibacillus sp. EC2-1 TaxID=3388665 RepID=UPI003BEEC339